MEFTTREFKAFRKDVNRALKNISKDYGVEIELGDIKYGTYDFDLKMNVTKNDGKINGKQMIFEQQCKMYGFDKTDYMREFTANGKRYKLVGFNESSPKNNCSIICLKNGKQYKCNNEIIKRAFANEKIAG